LSSDRASRFRWRIEPLAIPGEFPFPLPSPSLYLKANMRIATLPTLAIVACLVSATLLGQQSPPPAPRNLVVNGKFENSSQRQNLWQGVDSTGFLTGERGQVPVLTLKGEISDSAMPISVAVADMNADGLLDLVTMDVLGYLRVFFNSGDKQQPKFTLGDLAGIFLTRTAPNDPTIGREASGARLAPRIFPTDMMKSGKKDLLVGNYLGEVLFVPNGGSAQIPDFKQPQDVSRVAIPTMKDPKKRWGNVFAPCTWDWNADGKEDLLLGEGSYSANNIHLLINQGSGARPVFDETRRYVLAFGDGLEQLTPAVVDYNGDGAPDLLVAERSGKIAVYLNKGGEVKANAPPPEIPFASFIAGSGGSPLTFGGISTVSTGDFNGDGLFDLIVGKTNGRIAMALNVGTKTEPKFGPPAELKGTPGTPPFQLPSGWDVELGIRRGNFFGYMNIVKAEEDKGAQLTEGKCLKVGYVPPQNKLMPAPSVYTAAFPGFSLKEPKYGQSPEEILMYGPARYFMLRQWDRFRLKANTSYILSFKVKGRISDGQAFIAWSGSKKLSDEKVIQGERGSAEVQRNEVEEKVFETIKFSPSPIWTEVRKEFRVALKDKNLQGLKEMSHALLEISFSLPPGGEAYIDDVTIIERPST
jgi:FG-GAP-like repeat/FG-GAP repeat